MEVYRKYIQTKVKSGFELTALRSYVNRTTGYTKQDSGPWRSLIDMIGHNEFSAGPELAERQTNL